MKNNKEVKKKEKIQSKIPSSMQYHAKDVLCYNQYFKFYPCSLQIN